MVISMLLGGSPFVVSTAMGCMSCKSNRHVTVKASSNAALD